MSSADNPTTLISFPTPMAPPVQAARYVPRPTRLAVLMVVVLPFLSLALAAIQLWGAGANWLYLGLLGGMGVMTSVGVTVGFHRLFTHSSFQTIAPIRWALAIVGSMAIEGPVLKWVAVHRLHHQHSDEAEDPHSPHVHGGGIWGVVRGLWHAHVGWMFGEDHAGLEKYIPDLRRDRVLCVLSRLFPAWAVLGLLLPALIGGLITWTWTGAALGLLWGGLVRVFFVHHVTWSINSVCHIWGSQPFKTRDHSRNNVFFGYLALGEGWHNNHHAFPASARHGLRWWQLDLSYLLIRSMAMVGLAWRVKLPPRHRMVAKLAG